MCCHPIFPRRRSTAKPIPPTPRSSRWPSPLTSCRSPKSRISSTLASRQKFRSSAGVGLVTISGGQKPAVRIQANPVALASYGIDLESLRTALTSTSVNAAKGNFDGPRQDYQIDANDQLVTSDDYRDIVVAYRNGAPVFLKNVASVTDGVENSRQAAWMNDTPAVILNIQRQPGANTINVVKSIQSLLPQLEPISPPASTSPSSPTSPPAFNLPLTTSNSS